MGSLHLPHTAEEQGRVLLGNPILNNLPVFSWVSFRLMKTLPSCAEVELPKAQKLPITHFMLG